MFYKKIVFALCIAFCSVFAFSQTLTGEEWLTRADAKLAPPEISFKWSLDVLYEDGYNSVTEYSALKKGDDKYVFFAYSPSSQYGTCNLRIESSIWNYFPSADYTTRSSYKAAFLNSGLSYFDVMYSELSALYNSEIENNSVSVQSKDGSVYDCIQLKLTPKAGADDAYGSIMTYIEKDSYLTIKREYFSLSGLQLKTIDFLDYVLEGENVVAFNMDIIDLMGGTTKTTARFWDMQIESNIPDRYFSVNFIKTWIPVIE